MKLGLTLMRALVVGLLAAQSVWACSWDYLIWQARGKSADPMYRFVVDGKAGYIDRTGKVVIKPTFDAHGNYSGVFHNGLLNVDGYDGPFFDLTGKEAINNGFYRNWDFSEGLAAAMHQDGGKWGYIDRSGTFTISPRFDDYPRGYVFPFSDGVARIDAGDKFGYINRSGDFIIPPRFLHGSDFAEGVAAVVVDGPCWYGEMGPCPDGEALGPKSSGRPPACKFALIDKTGAFISKLRFDYVKEFSEGLAPVRVGDKWGYVDKSGWMAISAQFDDAEPFADGLALVQIGSLGDRRFGYIDHQGSLVIPPRFKYAEDFSDGLAPVTTTWNQTEFRHENFYYINKSGQRAFAGNFMVSSHYFQGIAHVRLTSRNFYSPGGDADEKSRFAYIDTSGKTVFEYVGER